MISCEVVLASLFWEAPDDPRRPFIERGSIGDIIGECLVQEEADHFRK